MCVRKCAFIGGEHTAFVHPKLSIVQNTLRYCIVICGLLGCTIFLYYFINGMIFGKSY
jgi:hypothetical protein